MLLLAFYLISGCLRSYEKQFYSLSPALSLLHLVIKTWLKTYKLTDKYKVYFSLFQCWQNDKHPQIGSVWAYHVYMESLCYLLVQCAFFNTAYTVHFLLNTHDGLQIITVHILCKMRLWHASTSRACRSYSRRMHSLPITKENRNEEQITIKQIAKNNGSHPDNWQFK